MSVELRLPYITGATEKEQLQQLKSYLYQLTEQLQVALNNVSAPSATQQVVVQTAINAPSSPSQPFDTEVTFAALKPLIIKSAEIVEAYYEEINRRLTGIYAAESAFGAFEQRTEQNVIETSERIDRAFTNIQTIETDLGGAKTTFEDGINGINTTINNELGGIKDDISDHNDFILKTQAHIKTGHIDDEERNGYTVPIYGIEVGQTDSIDGNTFKRYARFTAEKLSFYDENNAEAAYLSKSKLFINNAEIIISSKTGGFKDEVNQSTGDVVTKWEGWG